jgi:hypothetical protein
MKARIKATGEVFDVVDILLRSGNGGADVFCIEDVEIINESQTAELFPAGPDWEARRFEAAIAAMQGLCVNVGRNGFSNSSKEELVECAVEYADSLITELKKQKP